MELNKTKPGYYILILSFVAMVFALGSWWLYLVFTLAVRLQDLNHPLLQGNLVSMIKWEGVTFFLLLLGLIVTLVYVYFQDFKKTKSMQAFFASLTHELKTPLASIKLQTQVLQEKLSEINLNPGDKTAVEKLTLRLITDGQRLEDQLDNHLQLSRVERKAQLNLRELPILSIIQNEHKRYADKLSLKIINLNIDDKIYGDDFAVQTIFRNFFENTIRHSAHSSPELIIEKLNSNSFSIRDNGKGFSGESQKLGQLFYKHNSPKGSGIGLFLIQRLVSQMGGELKIETSPSLIFQLQFQNKRVDDES